MLLYVALVVAGTANGLITGLTGANGMAVVLSILLLAGFDVHAVIGMCLAVQIFTMSSALLPLTRAVGLAWSLVPVLCVPALFASFGGARAALMIRGEVLTGLVIVALTIFGVLLLRSKSTGPDNTGQTAVGRPTPSQLATIALAGAGSGFMAGLLGGGGNIIVANALNRLLNVPFRRAVALSLCVGLVAAATGVIPYIQEGRVDLALAPWIIIPAIVVAWVSAQFGTSIPVARIRTGQGVYLLSVAGILVGREIL